MTSLNVTWRPDLIWPGAKNFTQDAQRMNEQLCQIWRRCAPPFFCYLRKTDGGGTYVPPGRARVNLPGYDLVWGFVPDYMHCVCLGVVKTLMEAWMATKNHAESYYSLHRTEAFTGDHQQPLSNHQTAQVHQPSSKVPVSESWLEGIWVEDMAAFHGRPLSGLGSSAGILESFCAPRVSDAQGILRQGKTEFSSIF